MVRIITNVSDLLGDDLKTEITLGSKIRIAASTFSIFAFEALRKELEQVSELQFIFTAPSFVTEKATDKVRRERRKFFIPRRDQGIAVHAPAERRRGREDRVRPQVLRIRQ